MVTTEKEDKVLKYLRNPLYIAYKKAQGHCSPIDDLSDEELVSLYNKMDAIIEDEGNFRKSIGSIDEMYLLELFGAKKTLKNLLWEIGLLVETEKEKI